MSTLTPMQEAKYAIWYQKNAGRQTPFAAWEHQQAKIDALTAEHQTLRTNYEFQRERADALQAKLELHKQTTDELLRAKQVAEEKLDALEKQEPVGWVSDYALKELPHGGYAPLHSRKQQSWYLPLYSQPVPASPEWFPIESAPKDKPILLSMPICGNMAETDRRVFEGRWNEIQQTWSAPSGFILLTEVTHWMPLPVPASPEIAKVELNMGDMLASCDLMAPVPADSEGEGK